MKLGLIGAGKMGKAFLRGALNAGVASPQATYVYTRTPGVASDILNEYNLPETLSVLELIDKTNTLLIAVKPKDLPGVLRSLTMGGAENHLIISVVAGVEIETIRKLTHPNARVVRVMPNTPAMIGKGACAYCLSNNITPSDEKLVSGLLNATGIALKVEESLMDAVTGVSGSGPAYMLTIMEAMSDAGVLCGLPRDESIKLAAQTMLGAASMVLETGIHPSILRDQVTSPAGTTIAGIAAMEKHGVRHAMIEAVKASASRSAEIGKSSALWQQSSEHSGSISHE